MTTTLHRTIGLWQGVALYVGAILGPGLLLLPSVAAETAGPASLVAWAALVGLSLPMALTYAALARELPEAGGFAAYVERAFGGTWGALTGWLFFFSIPSGCVIVALIAGRYGAGALDLGREALFLVGGTLVIAAYAANLYGLRLSARMQVLVSAAIVGLLAVAIAGALPRIRADAFVPFAPYGALPIGLAAVQLFWAFAGWEAITPLAEEFRDPRRDMWRATLLAVGVVGVTYGALAVAVVGTRAYGDVLGGAPPLGAMAAASFGVAAQVGAAIVALFVSFGAVNAYVAGTSRLGYALGRGGRFPQWFAALHPRWRSPHHALVFLFAGFLAWLVAAYLFRLEVADLLPISTASYIATYVLSMAAATRLLRGTARLAAWIGLIACVIVLLFVGAFFAWIAGVTVVCLAYQRWRADRVARQTKKGAAVAD